MKKYFLIVCMLCFAGSLSAQTILIRDANKKPVKGASVSVQVKYGSREFLLEKSREQFITFVTDTLGKISLKGEFQKNNFEVESVAIKVQHADYEPYEVTTKDYSSASSFNYTIYLVYKNTKFNLAGKLTTNAQEMNELDIYSADEIAGKLGVKEEDVITLINKGKLRGKKIGEKYFVSGNDLRKYLEE